MLDYLIIGAGISGVAFGRLLQINGVDSFTILESENEAGGLCRTKTFGSCYLDTGGGHFLCTKYDEVYEFIFSHIPKSDFNFYDRVSKINLDSNVIDYPIESNIWQLPAGIRESYLAAIEGAGSVCGVAEPSNYQEWIRWKLGHKIAVDYLEPYNQKLWGVKPSEMDVDWLQKIPQLDVAAIKAANDKHTSDKKYFPSHARFYYPKYGGFQAVFDAIAVTVQNHIQCDYKVGKLEFRNGTWMVNGEIEARRVINTAPWPTLYAALGYPEHLSQHFEKLRHNSLAVTLAKASYDHDHHWVYLPDTKLRHHRTFYINNFCPYSKPKAVFTETEWGRWNSGIGAYPYEHDIIHTNHAEYAYPIPTLGHTAAIESIHSHYKEKGLIGLGRWGQWQYFNSDVCIFKAMELINELKDQKAI